jgi:hypothetical protein
VLTKLEVAREIAAHLASMLYLAAWKDAHQLFGSFSSVHFPESWAATAEITRFTEIGPVGQGARANFLRKALAAGFTRQTRERNQVMGADRTRSIFPSRAIAERRHPIFEQPCKIP